MILANILFLPGDPKRQAKLQSILKMQSWLQIIENITYTGYLDGVKANALPSTGIGGPSAASH